MPGTGLGEKPSSSAVTAAAPAGPTRSSSVEGTFRMVPN